MFLTCLTRLYIYISMYSAKSDIIFYLNTNNVKRDYHNNGLLTEALTCFINTKIDKLYPAQCSTYVYTIDRCHYYSQAVNKPTAALNIFHAQNNLKRHNKRFHQFNVLTSNDRYCRELKSRPAIRLYYARKSFDHEHKHVYVYIPHT